MLRIYWNLAHLIFWISQSRFWCQSYFHQIFITCLAQIGPKIRSTQNLLKFGTINISNMQILILLSKILPKMKNAQNLLRFGPINISNMLISILMSKWFLLNIYHLLGPNWSKIKSVQKLFKSDTFNISIMLILIWCLNNFYQILTNC